MQTYDKIIARIAEIIEISKQKKKTLMTNEDKGANFVEIHWKDIAIELVQEYNDLLNKENTIYILSQSRDPFKKNNELITLCQNHLSTSTEFVSDYSRLLEILNNSKNSLPLELSVYLGYFIENKDLEEFLDICKKLGVGTYEYINDQNHQDVTTSLLQPREQFHRINAYIEKTKKTESVITENLKNSRDISKDAINLNEPINKYSKKIFKFKNKELIYLGIINKLDKNMVANFKKILSDKEFEILLNELSEWNIINNDDVSTIRSIVSSNEIEMHKYNGATSDFKELIYLGINGKLPLNTIVELRKVMTDIEYDKLLNDLIKYDVINSNDKEVILNSALSTDKPLQDINDLVGLFVLEENVNIDAVKLLASGMEKNDFIYLLQRLHKFGKITFDDYITCFDDINNIFKR